MKIKKFIKRYKKKSNGTKFQGKLYNHQTCSPKRTQRKNIFNIPMLRGIFDILKFNKNAINFVKEFPHITLGELINRMHLKSWFRDYYILPMGGAIWSCSYQKIMDFPASIFVSFF